MVPPKSWAFCMTTLTLPRSVLAGVILHRVAEDLHAALGGIVKAGDEADEAGFAAARATDDADGLALFRREADVGQAGCTGPRIGQAHMVEPDGIVLLLGGHLHPVPVCGNCIPGLVSSTACTRPAQASALLTCTMRLASLTSSTRIWFM